MFPIVETPDTFSCLENKVIPVTVVIPANVETPLTFKLVGFDCVILAVANVDTPVEFILPETLPVILPIKLVAVTIPALIVTPVPTSSPVLTLKF